MATPTYVRLPNGDLQVNLPEGTKLGQYEIRTTGATPKTTRQSTIQLFGDTLRSGRTTWASGLHNRTHRDVDGVQPWERDLGRWTDLRLLPSIDYQQGWGEPNGKPGDPGIAWGTWAMTSPSANQFGVASVIGMAIMPHKIPVRDANGGLTYDSNGVLVTQAYTEHDTESQAAVHRDIVAGKYDWVYTQVAKNFLANGLGNAIVRIDWEAQGTWYQHGTQLLANAALHGQAVAHAASIMLDVAPGLRFSLDTSSHLYMPTGTGRNWLDAYYPQQYAPSGKTVTHLLVTDIYFAYNRFIGRNPSYDQFVSMINGAGDPTVGVTLGATAQFAVDNNLPLGIGEWGLVNRYKQDGVTLNDNKNGSGDAPEYITMFHRWLTEHPEVAYEGYWCLGDWSVNDLQTDLRAYYPESYAEYKRLWGVGAA